MRLGIKKRDQHHFKGKSSLEIIYNGQSTTKEITGRLFQIYFEVDDPIFKEWSVNSHCDVIVDISKLDGKTKGGYNVINEISCNSGERRRLS